MQTTERRRSRGSGGELHRISIGQLHRIISGELHRISIPASSTG
jgi:hypothetical protein